MAGREWNELLPAVERLIELVERLLRDRAPADPRGPGDPTAGDALAFRWVSGGLEPIHHPDVYPLDHLLGVERAVSRLRANTRAFCAGEPALDVLLYGERGTGKSSAVRGLLGEFAQAGLRLVEVRRDDLLDLPRIFAALRDRPAYFALICDDLSFGENDPSYRELKAVLDGGVEARPPNVMLMATSNRRHLVPERRWENLEATHGPAGDLHPGETAEEKLSLSDRFGLMLGFFTFDQETYLEIVNLHAREMGLDQRLPAQEIRARALRFALDRAGRTGRCARQACIEMLQDAPKDGPDGGVR